RPPHGSAISRHALFGDPAPAPAGPGRHWADAEPRRLRGQLLGRLPSADRTEIESCFRTALAIAREQGSRGFELRGAVSLARLLSARELLTPVYGRFTDGFDTPELKDAKTLLAGRRGACVRRKGPTVRGRIRGRSARPAQGEPGPHIDQTRDERLDVGVAVQRRRRQP